MYSNEKETKAVDRSTHFTITSGVPVPIWYALAMIGASYYAVAYSDSPRVWGFALAYWVIAAVFLYSYSRIQPFDIFSPVIGLIGLLFLYSFASALYVENLGVMPSGEPVNDWVLIIYYLCCLAGLSGLALGAFLGSRDPKSPTKQRNERQLVRGLPPDPEFVKKLMFWSVALGTICAPFVLPLFNIFHVSAYSERALSLRLEHSGSANSGLKEVFFTRLPATYILCSGVLLMLVGRHYATRLAGLLVFTLYVTANTLAGWRGAVITALLIPLVYYHYRVKAFSGRFVFVLGVSVYLFINALSVARVTSNPLEMLTLVRDNIGTNGVAFASLSSSGELMVGTNLMRLISGIEAGETHLTMGRSVVSEFLVFVPRSLYAARPLPLSEKYVQVFYPDLWESGGGRGFFILQEGYWAFGIGGVFLFMLAYGWGVQRIYLRFMTALSNDLAVLLYSGVYAAIVVGAVRTGVVSSLKGAAISSVPFLLLWCLVRIRPPKLP